MIVFPSKYDSPLVINPDTIKILTFSFIITPFKNLTTKQDKTLPPFCVVDLLQDSEGSYLHDSGEDFHVRFAF